MPVVVGEKERERERERERYLITTVIYTATSSRFGRLGKEVLRHQYCMQREVEVTGCCGI